MDENAPAAPRTAYGRSKLEAERIVAASGAERGHRWVVPRFSPVWTAEPLTGFLGAFRDQVTGGSILRKVGWPGRITIIHRDDAVTVLIALGEGGLADGGAVHVGDGRLYRYADLLRDLRRRHGDEGGFLPIPGFVWALIRRCAWLPLLRRLVPWRLSCLLGDDLAVDATKLHRLLPGRYLEWGDDTPR
jgi:nucleoside-diphosphate-sugar epimerase